MKHLFEPGRILMTPGAVDVLKKHLCLPSSLLVRHLVGDLGDVDAHDAGANKRALNPHRPERILSSYKLGDDTIWIITEHDRSVTTLLLPSEY